MHILITGASGLVGRTAVESADSRGWDVTAVDRTPAPDGFPHRWIQCELAEVDLPEDAFHGVSAVAHLAAIPSPGHVPDAYLFTNNVSATFRVLDAAGRAGVPRAVIASSISIYGLAWAPRETTPPEVPLSETSELKCADPYALSKEVDEATARMVARRYGMSTAALRLPNISSVETVIERSEATEKDIAYAHKELWAYLTTADAADAICAAAEADFHGAVVANVVSRQSLARVDAVQRAREFFPDARFGGGTSGYTTAIAETTFGFVGAEVLSGEDDRG
jgi:nucleoside-diphosphate-sugar epimerase